MTREDLVSNLDSARTARDVALAEVAGTHQVLIEEAEKALADFDANADVVEVVENIVNDVPAQEVESVLEIAVDETVVAEDDDNSPTAEEEEILRRATEIEAKYKRE